MLGSFTQECKWLTCLWDPCSTMNTVRRKRIYVYQDATLVVLCQVMKEPTIALLSST